MLGYVFLYFTTTKVPVFIGSLFMMIGYLTGMAVFGAVVRENIPEDKSGLFQGIRIMAVVLIFILLFIFRMLKNTQERR